MSARLAWEAGAPELAAAAGCLWLAVDAWRRRGGRPPLPWALRLAVAILLGTVALKPVLERGLPERVRPRLAIVLDVGASMAANDDQGRSRLSRAAGWLARNREAIEESAEPVIVAGLAEGERLSWDQLRDLRPSASPGELCAALARLRGAAPLERVWVLSDGAFGRECAPSLGTAPSWDWVPIEALGAGPLRAPPSLRVTEVQAPDFVFLHARFPISVAVEAAELAGSEARVRLYSGERLLEEKTFTVGAPFEVLASTFTAEADRLGSMSFRVEASAARASAGKAGPKPSSRELRVESIRSKHRIMYLAGRPGFEYAHLREQLKSDPNHELVSFVILRNPENPSPVSDSELSLIPFPAHEIFVASLPQFDIFILENFAYGRFGLPSAYLQNLRDFVSRGGALLVLGGSSGLSRAGYAGTPLEEALPVTLGGIQGDDFVPGLLSPELAAPDHPLLRLGDTPQSSGELWGALPPLDGFTRFGAVRPGTSVLLRHPSEKTSSGQPLPLMAVRDFGRGKVMVIGTDSTWRWKLGAGRDWRLASFYGRFWSRAVQYLTGTLELKRVKFSPLPDRMPEREPATLSLRAFNERFEPLPGSELDLRLLWTDPSGRQRAAAAIEREPGLFQVELSGLTPGAHSVRAVARRGGQLWGEDEARFRWEGPRADAPLDRGALRALADASGGGYSDLAAADPAELLSRLPPVVVRRQVRSRAPLWSSPLWLWAALGLLLAEWLLRRRRGFL